MSLSLIPAIALLVVVVLTNPSSEEHKKTTRVPSKSPVVVRKASPSKKIEKKEDPLVKVENPSGENIDYQAILVYIKSKFKTIGDKDAEDISYHLVDYGNQFDVDPKFAAAVIARESAFNKNAISSTGAKGLGQIKDFNYPSLSISDPYSITENVRGTTKYLKEMLTNWQKTKDAYQQKITTPEEKSYKEINQSDKVKLALASYYKGFTAVKNGNGELDTKTQGYVGDILSFYDEISSIRENLEKEELTQK